MNLFLITFYAVGSGLSCAGCLLPGVTIPQLLPVGCFIVSASVGDPDPQDLYVFEPPGSRSISQRCVSGSGSFSFLINVLSRLK
jgi:hypothetical protein